MLRTILIKSCQKNAKRRKACWETWGQEILNAGVMIVNATGGHETAKFDIQPSKPLDLEMAIGDTYDDNSAKLSNAIARLLFVNWTHLFICDDDTFIHPERWLNHTPEGDFEGRLYHPKTQKDHKLNYGLPWINGGAGWWMTKKTALLYVQKTMTRCSWDDVLATRYAQEAGIPISDRPDLYGDSRNSDSPLVAKDNRLITSHGLEPEAMRELWKGLRA